MIKLFEKRAVTFINFISPVLMAISIFLTLIVMHFMLGNFDSQSIALFIFSIAGVIFSAAFIYAKLKDRMHRRKTSQLTVFES